LPGHESAFGGVGLLADGGCCFDKVKLCAGRRREFLGKFFHQGDFPDLN
jgi:hypothetical protein